MRFARPRAVTPNHYIALITVCLYLLLTGFQMFGPVPIGLSDNGDFPKIFGALNIGPAAGMEESLTHRYFFPNYTISDHFHWISGIASSEYWLAKTGKRLALWFSPQGSFDLRYMGAVHALIMSLALWLFVRAFRGFPTWYSILAAALLLFICTDIEYVQFFSTGYSDAASIVFFCCFVAVALNICLNPDIADARWIGAYALFGSLFLSSKLQHQPALFPVAALAIYFAWRANSQLRRLLWVIPLAAFAMITSWIVNNTSPDYRSHAIYPMIFTRLAPMSGDPDQVLKDFGLPEYYRKYVGTLPFQDDYLLNDEAQRNYFVKQITLRRIARYYWNHPSMCFRVLYSDLKDAAPDVNLEVWDAKRFRIGDYAAHKDDMRFKWWSSARRKIALTNVFLGPALYVLTAVLVILCLLHRRLAEQLPAWPVLGLLTIVGSATFIVASLNDTIETSRHIIIYQVALDFLIFLLILESVRALSRSGLARQSYSPDELVPPEPRFSHLPRPQPQPFQAHPVYLQGME